MNRKRYLIVAMDMGHSVLGIVFQALAKSMYKYADIDILSPIFEKDNSLEGIGKTLLRPRRQLTWPQIKRRWKRYRFNPNDKLWILSNIGLAFKSIRKQKYDGVISFTAMNSFPSIGLGRILAKALKVPWSIYTVDGIPSPVEWLDGDNKIHELLARHVNRSCRKADFIFSSNEYMIEYQKRICHDFKGTWSFLYTPHKQTQSYAKTEHKGYRFLYAGSLYGLRKVDGLLTGFRRFLQEHPDSRITFVGDVNPSSFATSEDLIQSGNIILKTFCKDLTDYYKEADVLLDIGADIPNDVFLSSKIVSYLHIDRPILAITGENSPARGIMGGLPSIIHSGNQGDEIYQAMQACIQAIDKGIDDRTELIHEFDSDTIARKLCDTIV